ncbi:MAG: tRNA (adenosine(37)-N6)-dimethylallyltransferase MiaA [Rickettsiales bacterium]|nr:tRNA (adenosine(37)-N6)-dimethylallyltransferase MiaA [Rickettsiales bacterium]|tara:strand:- start:2700 stop:3596 length:897 start_codon:yes stop_codon:yes gene_type:complete
MNSILIVGPTASGKSGFAQQLQKKIGGTIVNADSCQVYQNVVILSAQPSITEQQQSPHALYATTPPDQNYSVGHYLDDVRRLLKTNPKQPLIFVGGTGLYLSALTKGLDVGPSSEKIRKHVQQAAQDMGMEGIYHLLKTEVPNFNVHFNNHQRLLRAYEIYLSQQETPVGKSQTKPAPLNNTKVILLNPPADQLRQKIKKRLGQMITEGAIQEVEFLQKKYPTLGTSAQKIIGIQELSSYLQNTLTLDKALEKIYIRTCQYAKRQRTWFRHKISIDHEINAPWTAHDITSALDLIKTR